MRVIYDQPARAARNHFIAERPSPDAAARLYKRFDEVTSLLGRFPHLGREGRRPGTRELLIAGTPYLFIYRITKSTIVILEIVHSGRDT